MHVHISSFFSWVHNPNWTFSGVWSIGSIFWCWAHILQPSQCKHQLLSNDFPLAVVMRYVITQSWHLNIFFSRWKCFQGLTLLRRRWRIIQLKPPQMIGKVSYSRLDYFPTLNGFCQHNLNVALQFKTNIDSWNCLFHMCFRGECLYSKVKNCYMQGKTRAQVTMHLWVMCSTFAAEFQYPEFWCHVLQLSRFVNKRRRKLHADRCPVSKPNKAHRTERVNLIFSPKLPRP
jgi:hypothetical protein